MLATTMCAAMALSPIARVIRVAVNPTFPQPKKSLVREYLNINPGISFDEIVPSWNVANPYTAAIKVELRGHVNGKLTRWYTMADWAYTMAHSKRISFEHERDADAAVLTDTLRFKSLANGVDVRLTLQNTGDGELPSLKLFALSFKNTGMKTSDSSTPSEAWGKTVEVPQRAQGNYKDGAVICSPTTVSMLLKHWSVQLNQPAIDRDVPLVKAGVWDEAYKGGGNWSFNMAFAGSTPGLRAYVARLTSIADAEKWIAAGIPVGCSVEASILWGKGPDPSSGHLVVLVGFTKDGDPIFNDPARRAEVRRTFKRADFELAWQKSDRTVYLVYPESAKVPGSSDGLWLSSGS